MELSENSCMLLEYLNAAGRACIGEINGVYYVISSPDFNWDRRINYQSQQVKYPECLEELVNNEYIVFGEYEVVDGDSEYSIVGAGHRNRVHTLTKKGREAGFFTM